MQHDEWLDRIDEVLDMDDPADPERLAFEAHLADCPECRAEVEAYRKLRRLALALPPVAIPDDLGYRIRRRLDEARGGGAQGGGTPPGGRIHRLRPWLGVSAAAAVLLAAVLAGLHLFATGKAPAGGEATRVAAERPADPPERTESPPPAAPAGDPALALGDFLVQAAHAAPDDLPRLHAEAEGAALLPRIRAAAAMSGGDRRRFLTAGADLLIQFGNTVQLDDSAGAAALAAEAHLVLAGRPR